jgi:hypothetical protein
VLHAAFVLLTQFTCQNEAITLVGAIPAINAAVWYLVVSARSGQPLRLAEGIQQRQGGCAGWEPVLGPAKPDPGSGATSPRRAAISPPGSPDGRRVGPSPMLRQFADQLRPKWPKLPAFIDDSETDVARSAETHSSSTIPG